MPTFNITISKRSYFSNTVNYEYYIKAENMSDALEKAKESAESESPVVSVEDYDYSDYAMEKCELSGLRVVK